MNYNEMERLIVKVGTGFFFDKAGGKYKFLKDQFYALADEVASVCKEKELVLVTSGAIAMGAFCANMNIPHNNYEREQLAAIGQPKLMLEYINRIEKRHGILCAQCLPTYRDIDDRRPRRKLRMHQDGYFRDGVLGIYNENDFVATDEIRFGDNDILAAKLAKCLDVDALVMLSTPVEGLGRGGGESKRRAKKILDEGEKIPLYICNGRYEKGSNGLWMPKIRAVGKE